MLPQLIESWWQQRKKRGFFEFFLAGLALIYRFGVALRHWCYDFGLLSVTKSALPVISIGNITVGGSGKTPLVYALVSLLEQEYHIAIVSRGYRRKEAGKSSLIVSLKGREILSWQQGGDEPYLLAKWLKKASVIVSRSRVEGVKAALDIGCDIVVLDDGMQHRRLSRDLEIIILEGEDPFSEGRFLPRGRLREDPKRLASADLIVINGEITVRERQKLESVTKAPCVKMVMAVTDVVTRGEKRVNVAGEKVAVFCALGSPVRFVKTVQSLGAEVVATYFLPDHTPFSREGLLAFFKQAKSLEAKYLCCTEKDGIKLPEMEELKEEIVLVKGELVIKGEREPWIQVIERIKSLAKEEK